MATARRKVAVAAAALLSLSGAVWFGFSHHRKYVDCKVRNHEFNQRIRDLKIEALEQLRVGTKKEDVVRFFERHGMRYVFTEIFPAKMAQGSMYSTGGCAPLGCGTDNVLIGVEVKVDDRGAVIAEPRVIGMYIDCV